MINSREINYIRNGILYDLRIFLLCESMLSNSLAIIRASFISSKTSLCCSAKLTAVDLFFGTVFYSVQ